MLQIIFSTFEVTNELNNMSIFQKETTLLLGKHLNKADIQKFYPPHKFINLYRIKALIFLNSIFFDYLPHSVIVLKNYFHKEEDNFLTLDILNVCNIKDIFVLGKNKFDRSIHLLLDGWEKMDIFD